MQLLDWKPSYALGIPSVDMEHRLMIDMINEVFARVEENRDVDAVQAALADIHAGISAHFALEERMMREAAYPGYAAHKEDHEDLLDQIRDIMDSYSADPEAGGKLLRSSLSDWFGVHFATFDARLHNAGLHAG